MTGYERDGTGTVRRFRQEVVSLRGSLVSFSFLFVACLQDTVSLLNWFGKGRGKDATTTGQNFY